MRTKLSRKPKQAEANTYGLPRGEPIRKELRLIFRDQRRQMLAVLGGKIEKKDDQIGGGPLPDHWPEFRLGNLAMSERMTPILSVYWDQAGRAFRSRNQLDPDAWEVSDPNLKRKIEASALDFCAETNATTRHTLDEALDKLRAELIAGTVTKGESVRELTKRVNAIFDGAETWRARRIAQSEASRAVHAAQEQSGIDSGVVAGWEWLLSSDACPLCQAVGEKAKFVRAGQDFAVVGDHPTYSHVRFPPLHPHCNCTVLEVLKPEFGGPEDVPWAETLVQPKAEAESKPEASKPSEPAKPAGPDLKAMPIADAIKEYKAGDAKIAKILELEEIDKEWRRARNESSSTFAALCEATGNLGSSRPGTKRRATLEAIAEEKRAAHFAAKAYYQSLPTATDKLAEAIGIEGPRVRIESETGGRHIAPEAIDRAEQFVGRVLAKVKTGDTIGKIVYELTPDGREYSAGDHIGVKSTTVADVVVHEIGHKIELQIPGVKARVFEFLEHRLGDEKPQQLNKVIKGSRYKDDEVGAKDKFEDAFGRGADWYVGKEYRTVEGKRSASEVVSMGLQYLYKDPVDFVKKDPEFAKFLLGILDGELRA